MMLTLPNFTFWLKKWAHECFITYPNKIQRTVFLSNFYFSKKKKKKIACLDWWEFRENHVEFLTKTDYNVFWTGFHIMQITLLHHTLLLQVP